MHFTDGVTISDDKGSITVEMKGFETVDGKKLPKWEVEKPVLGTVSKSRTSSNGNVTVPGYKTNREYLLEIADQDVKDLLVKHNDDWTKINASQHIIRIEKTFTDDSKKLYHHAKGII